MNIDIPLTKHHLWVFYSNDEIFQRLFFNFYRLFFFEIKILSISRAALNNTSIKKIDPIIFIKFEIIIQNPHQLLEIKYNNQKLHTKLIKNTCAEFVSCKFFRNLTPFIPEFQTTSLTFFKNNYTNVHCYMTALVYQFYKIQCILKILYLRIFL